MYTLVVVPVPSSTKNLRKGHSYNDNSKVVDLAYDAVLGINQGFAVSLYFAIYVG